MDSSNINRREFIRQLGVAGGSLLLASSPWLSAFSEQAYTEDKKCRLGIVGTGERGRFLMELLAGNPRVEICGLCDIYRASMLEAVKISPKATVYGDYRELLEDKTIDAVIVATPLRSHYKIVCDAFDAGKSVLCESTIGFTLDECRQVYEQYLKSHKIFFTGLQRLFNPKYIRAMELLHDGKLGDIQHINATWNCYESWERPVSSVQWERMSNWRICREFSKGIMTELACHQLQVGSWAMRKLPEKVIGHGSITFWKDAKREVYDNVSCTYLFDDGVKMTFNSIMSSPFEHIEEEIIGISGVMKPEEGRYLLRRENSASGLSQLFGDLGSRLFSPSGRTDNCHKGEWILEDHPVDEDGTALLLDAFVEAVITGIQPVSIAEEGYYASVMSLLGQQAMEEERTVSFPDEYKLTYLNHKAPASNRQV